MASSMVWPNCSRSLGPKELMPSGRRSMVFLTEDFVESSMNQCSVWRLIITSESFSLRNITIFIYSMYLLMHKAGNYRSTIKYAGQSYPVCLSVGYKEPSISCSKVPADWKIDKIMKRLVKNYLPDNQKSNSLEESDNERNGKSVAICKRHCGC